MKSRGNGRGDRDDGNDRNGICRRRIRILYIVTLTGTILLYIAAWNSREFCDWYWEHIFGIWVDTYGRAMGALPFSVGEVLIALSLLLAITLILLGLIWLTALKVEAFRRNRERLGRLCKGCGRISAWVLLGALVLMTLNCYILYHSSGFSGKYLIAGEREYTLEELAALRDYVVGQCNALCCQIPRNGDGSISYEGDMIETAKAAMRHLGETYEELSGFYPDPKPLLSSDFMSQQYVAGCFYPFSMEANYNDVMYVMNLPSTLCHELGHLKGFILEDEANLIGYLACVQSEDIFFRYSGYLSVLYYVDNDFRQALESGVGLDKAASWQSETLREGETQEQQEASYPGKNQEQQGASYPEKVREQAEDLLQLQILPQVHTDNIFLTAQERTRIEQKALLDTEAVDAISDSIADASLKLNGVQDGMISYSRVVELLLRYYEIYGYL